MFVKVLASTAAIAGGQVLRGMTYDAAADKIKIPNFLNVGDILYYEKNAGTAQSGLTDKTVYAVKARSLTDFSLIAVAAGTLEATGTTAVDITATTAGTAEATFTHISSLAKVTSNKASNNGLVLSHHLKKATASVYYGTTFAAGDSVVIYGSGGIKGGTGGTAATAAVAGKTEAGTVLKFSAELTVAAATDWAATSIQSSAGTAYEANVGHFGVTDANAVDQTNIFLLKTNGTAKKHPVMTTTAVAWDMTAKNKITGAHPFAGGEAVFYTATTIAKGLEDKQLYYTKATTNKEFQLTKATTTAVETATSTVAAFTAAGTGGSLLVVDVTANDKITASAIGDATAGGTLTTACNTTNCAVDAEVIFYCNDKTTAANCKWNGPVDGATYKIKASTANSVNLKDSAGAAVAITAVAADASTGKAWLLRPKKTGTDKQKFTLVAAPAAGASATRGLAVFGSAVAMATAFLMG